MDNRILNVNGRTKAQLTLALQFAFKNGWDKNHQAVGWRMTDEHGLILYSIAPSKKEGYNSFLTAHTAEQCVELIWNWVHSEDSASVKLSDWCEDIDHDGSNDKGWQLYLEDWGKVAGHDFVLCAAKPAYCWLGK